MFYAFPHARNIEPYLEAIRGKDEFVVAGRPEMGIVIINYVFTKENTFDEPMVVDPPPEDVLCAALRRDCRGIEFDIETGEVVTKKYHKFHNVGERHDYASHRIDWSQPHRVLEKLDGSMITPYRRRDGKLVWHTKMGATDVAGPVDRHVAESPLPYPRFAAVMEGMGQTPIFEWCSRQQRIVIDYPTDELVLTAVRDKHTGAYIPYPTMNALARRYGLPVVRASPASTGDIHAFLRDAAEIEGSEGYVIRFDSGHMCKVKARRYCTLHRVKEDLSSEKAVWQMILNDMLDDMKPNMQPADLLAVETFAARLHEEATRTALGLLETVERARAVCGTDKRRFAVDWVNLPETPKLFRQMLFSIWDGRHPVETVLKLLAANTATAARIDEVRCLVGGLDWKRFTSTPLATGA